MTEFVWKEAERRGMPRNLDCSLAELGVCNIILFSSRSREAKLFYRLKSELSADCRVKKHFKTRWHYVVWKEFFCFNAIFFLKHLACNRILWLPEVRLFLYYAFVYLTTDIEEVSENEALYRISRSYNSLLHAEELSDQ